MNIKNYLKQYCNNKIYYMPNPGNGGDALIALSTFKLFRGLNLDVSIASRNSDLTGQIVMYAGGGSLVREYNHSARILALIHKKVEKLIVLPHSINSHQELLRDMGGNVDIICRERYSERFVLESRTGANVLLMDDLALGIDPLEVLARKHCRDALMQKSLRYHLGRKSYFADCVAKLFLGQMHQREFSCFREDVERSGFPVPPGNIDLPIHVNYDRTQSCFDSAEMTVHNIMYFLSGYDVVVTNRLHICIAACLLGKQVKLYANSYFKNKAVYEYSLVDRFDCVEWCG